MRRKHAENRGWPRMGAGAAYTAVGLLLTLVTTILCFSNAISVLQAIALSLPATVITLGGWISLIVPGTHIAWRRGFEQGCKVAMSFQTPDVPAKAAAEMRSQAPGQATVTDLVGRYGRRSGQWIQPGDGY